MWIPTAVVAEQWPRRAMELVAVAIARVEVVGAREGHLPNQAVPVLEAMMIRATGHVNTAPSPIRSQLPFVRCVSSVGKSLLEGESTILFIGRDQVLSLLAFCLAGYMWRKTGLLYLQSSLRGMNLSEKGKEWRLRKVKWVGKQKEITSRICKSVMCFRSVSYVYSSCCLWCPFNLGVTHVRKGFSHNGGYLSTDKFFKCNDAFVALISVILLVSVLYW